MIIRDAEYVNKIKGLLLEHQELTTRMNTSPRARAFELTQVNNRIMEIETSLTAFAGYEVEALRECLSPVIDNAKLIDILNKGRRFADRKLEAMQKFFNKLNYTTWFDDFVDELVKLIILSGRSFANELDSDQGMSMILLTTKREEKSDEKQTIKKF